MTNFLDDRTQRVILNGQYSSWGKTEAGFSQGSVLGPLLFLIYINELSEKLASNFKLFANDTLLFSVVKDIYVSDIDLKIDFKKINECTFQWILNFNPDPAKQALELIFSHKVLIINNPPLSFNENIVPQTILQKHLGICLDSKLNFSEHIKTIFQKTDKNVGLPRKLQTLPRAPLITIYKSLIRRHLDYGDMMYDQTFNMWFEQKNANNSVQCSFNKNRRNMRFLQGKIVPRIRHGDSSTTTLV